MSRYDTLFEPVTTVRVAPALSYRHFSVVEMAALTLLPHFVEDFMALKVADDLH